MTRSKSSIYDMSPLKLALAARQMKENLELMRAEPIAVIGMGCRFPAGGNSPDAYWRLLAKGVDAVGEIPPGRWDVDQYYDPDPGAPGKMYCRHGSFIDDIDRFDARLFGISPREASAMDPQQRVLLETAWAAVHNAGMDADKLYGSDTGVYIGISTYDYAALQLGLGMPARVDPYYVSGTVLSVAAGRLSYVLGLKGPSMSLDTACSSSLVAAHQACEALRRRECDLALMGGVGLIMAPEPGISFCKAGLLSPDGRCKSFDDAADGYGRGEGCGVLVLKRLGDALADGDSILALIRGSDINQDGASGGLTVPSGPSQEAVIRTALANSGLRPDQLGYIEAHGTGTPLGDPIEMGALWNVFGTPERPEPLWVGSAKTNFGHLEAAAGVAGMIKLILSFQHKKIPEHLHFNTPSRQIDWDRHPIQIPRRLMDWPMVSGRMIAGVSSFGFCGTNAHVVMEGFEQGEIDEKTTGDPISFDRQRYWIDTKSCDTGILPAEPVRLPGKRLHLPFSGEIRFECLMGENTFSYLPDHRLFGHLVVAGASHLSMIIEGIYAAFGLVECSLSQVSLQAPLIIPVNRKRLVQLILSPLADEDYNFKLVSSQVETKPDRMVSGEWTLHVQGVASVGKEADDARSINLEEFRGPHHLTGAELYDEISAMGHHLGPSFCWVETVEWQNKEILSKMAAPEGVDKTCRFHPGLLDSCFQFFCIRGPQLVTPENNDKTGRDTILVPFAFETIHVHPPGETSSGPLYSLVQIQSGPVTDQGGLCADMVLADAKGRIQAQIKGFSARRLSASTLNTVSGMADSLQTCRVEWVLEHLSENETGAPLSLNCLILADQTGLGQKIAHHLKRRDCKVTLAYAGREDHEIVLEDGTVLSLSDCLTQPEQPIDRIFYLWGLDISELDTIESGNPDELLAQAYHRAYQMCCLNIMTLVQTIASLEIERLPHLALITRTGWNGQAGKEVCYSPFQAMVWGMGRVISLEHPFFSCTLVDWMDNEVRPSYINRLVHSRSGDQMEFVQGKCRTPRLKPLAFDDNVVSVNSETTYLITGGSGALGMAVAGRLAFRGAAHLVLAGRSLPGKAAQKSMDKLTRAGVDLRFVTADMGNEHDVRRILALIENDMPPLKGVVHAAGVLDDALLIRQDQDRMTRVLTPKVAGAWNLYQLTHGLDLDFMVFFSSMTSLLGTAGQAGYAAANAFMDGLAHYGRKNGRACLSINWGGWAGSGMAAGLGAREQERLTASGIGLIQADKGLEILEKLMASDLPQAGVMNLEWDKYAGSYRDAEPPVIISELIPVSIKVDTGKEDIGKKSATAIEIVTHLNTLPANAREQALVDYVRGKVTRILGFPGDTPVDVRAGLFDMGMDSITALQLKEQLAGELNRPVRSTLVFNYPSIMDISTYLKEHILPELFASPGDVESRDGSATPAAHPFKKQEPGQDIAADKVTAVVADDLDGLSEDELGAMLDDKLAEFDKWLS